MNDLIVSLPKEALVIRDEMATILLIDVVDDRTSIAAAENRKIVKERFPKFEEACEPERVRLETPYKAFLGMKKAVVDQVKAWIDTQSKSIANYELKKVREENEKRAAEKKRLDDEEKARIEKLNADRAAEAVMEGTTATVETFVPTQDPIKLKPKIQSEFVNVKVEEVPNATITDLPLYLRTLLDNGNDDWVKLIFDKWNQSQINKFCVARGINGRDKLYPGIAVEMKPKLK